MKKILVGLGVILGVCFFSISIFYLKNEIVKVDNKVIALEKAKLEEEKRKKEYVNNYVKNYANKLKDNIRVLELYKECKKDKNCLLEKMEEENIETYKDLYKKEGEVKNGKRFRD
ncbi:hypothetical protein [Aliarcobacter butzleri]|uniref:hypothetical protein n=1 Tax=Aliarcobacter butzleri TaxID=28197 RepID=UPI00126106AC|nr:hypothetical protein [Aliarcobacter butzleri]